jgi:hypothetical protein
MFIFFTYLIFIRNEEKKMCAIIISRMVDQKRKEDNKKTHEHFPIKGVWIKGVVVSMRKIAAVG